MGLGTLTELNSLQVQKYQPQIQFYLPSFDVRLGNGPPTPSMLP